MKEYEVSCFVICSGIATIYANNTDEVIEKLNKNEFDDFGDISDIVINPASANIIEKPNVNVYTIIDTGERHVVTEDDIKM